MQCVIICAGKGTRMRPLTDSVAKPLIPVCGKPVLDHIVEALPPEIDELILVVGYKQEQIREHCGKEFHGRKITYVEQENYAGGTDDALMCAKAVVQGRFLFMYADDIHGKEALDKLIEHESAVITATSDHPEDFAAIAYNDDKTVQAVIEKPASAPSNEIYIGGFVADAAIFDYDIPVSDRLGEQIVTDRLTAYAADHPVQTVTQSLWFPIGRPEDIAAAEAVLCPGQN